MTKERTKMPPRSKAHSARLKGEKEVAEAIPQPKREVDENGRFTEVLLNMEEWADILRAKKIKSKSSMIRYLWGMNHNRRAIADFLRIRYQHVRNVLVQQPKRPSTLQQVEEENTTEPGGDASTD